MKKIILTIAMGAMAIGCFAQVNQRNTHVNASIRKDGSYVTEHYRTTPNNTNRDNYTTKPNANPFTGIQGTIRPDNNFSMPKSSSNFNSSSSFSNPTGRRRK